MGVGKVMSLVLFVGALASIAVLLLGQSWGLWAAGSHSLWPGLIAAAIIASAAAAAFWLGMGSVMDADLARLRRFIEASSQSELSEASCRPRWWMRGVADAVNRTLNRQRQQIDQLTAQKRELEIQCRVVEAERQHAEGILHTLSDAVLVTDAFNEVALANDAAAEALRFDLEQTPHQPIDRVVNDATLVKLIKDTRESGNLVNRRHVEHVLAENGRSRVFDVTLSCMANPQDEVAGVVTILHDVTREKQVSEMKSDFVSSVSHELRTPLSSIKAYVEMLVDGEAPDEETRSEFYNIIQSETNRLSRLIDNILNISRIESGIIKVQREQVSLPAVIKEVMDVMQPQARAKNIDLSEPATPLYFQIYADKDMIYQALLNLVGNAIKYTPEEGSVTVESVVDDHDRMVTVHVSDSGVGIPADALPHLFEKFYRVNDHKKLAKGTGLGLNLVKHIVETVHGGKVAVTSEVGQGSTFSISLPISDGVM